MKPRRVLHVSRNVDGGVATVVDHLARGLERDRYEPIVLFDSSKQSHIRKKLFKSDIKTIDLNKFSVDQTATVSNHRKNKKIGSKVEAYFGKRSQQFYFSLKYFCKFMLWQVPRIKLFLRTIRENEIALVHTHHGLRIGKPEIIAARLAGVPCVSHCHGYQHLTHFDMIFSRFVASFIYISRDVAKSYISQKKSLSKGRIIHNGIDMSEFTRPYDTALVRNEFGIKSDQILVGIVGRIDWWKGHEYFLEAIAEAAKCFSIKGIIIGDLEKNITKGRNVKYFKKLQALVNSLDLEDKIIFTGFRSDVPSLMAALDVVVLATSTREPFGLVVIEGMAAGKPVVATGAGGVLDIIEDGVNGLLVPCKDSKAMAKGISQIISDKDKAQQMGLAARKRVSEKFTIQHQVTAIQNLYDFILASP